MPLSVAFIISIIYALFITPKQSLEARLGVFSQGLVTLIKCCYYGFLSFLEHLLIQVKS